MCYPKPGPRCSASAKVRLEEALNSHDALSIAKARQEYLLTPAGIQELRNQGRFDTADAMEHKREELIAKVQSNKQAQLASQKLSHAIYDDYHVPSYFDQTYLTGGLSSSRDWSDVQNGTITGFSDPMYYEQGYYGGQLTAARNNQTDFKSMYENTVDQADELIHAGNYDKADSKMDIWEKTALADISENLSESAKVDRPITHRILKDWNEGRREAINSEGSHAFATNQYDPQRVTHRVLAAQYQATQNFLNQNQIQTVRVYRPEETSDDIVASTTLDPSLAHYLGSGVIMYADVPKEKIVSLPQTGMGKGILREAVIHNDDIDWQYPSSIDTVQNGEASTVHQ